MWALLVRPIVLLLLLQHECTWLLLFRTKLTLTWRDHDVSYLSWNCDRIVVSYSPRFYVGKRIRRLVCIKLHMHISSSLTSEGFPKAVESCRLHTSSKRTFSDPKAHPWKPLCHRTFPSTTKSSTPKKIGVVDVTLSDGYCYGRKWNLQIGKAWGTSLILSQIRSATSEDSGQNVRGKEKQHYHAWKWKKNYLLFKNSQEHNSVSFQKTT